MSAKSDRIVVGQVAGVYGVKGWVKIKSFTEPEENIVQYAPWWLRTRHGLKQMRVDDHLIRPQGVLVHFEGVDDRDIAAGLGRAKIEVARELLPALSDGDFYWHQLVGLAVICDTPEGEVRFGVVSEMLETGANDVMVIQPDASSVDQRERLLPYVPGAYVTSVDLDAGQIRVLWDPEF